MHVSLYMCSYICGDDGYIVLYWASLCRLLPQKKGSCRPFCAQHVTVNHLTAAAAENKLPVRSHIICG